MRDLRVGVDLDGTLSRTMEAVCRLVNFRRGTKYTEQDVTSWDFWKTVGLDGDLWDAFDLIDAAGFRRGLKPYDAGTFLGLEWLMGNCRNVEIITANRVQVQNDVIAWVRAGLPDESLGLPVVRCLGRISSRAKLAFGYDVYIDDAPALAGAIKEHNAANTQAPPVKLLLPDNPWNRDVETDSDVIRFSSWDEVPYIIDEIAHARRLVAA